MPFIARRASTSLLLKTMYSLHNSIDAGIPIVRSLELTAEASTDKRMRLALKGIAVGLQAGDTISQAVKPYQPFLGDELTMGLSAGDVSGKLEKILAILVDIYEYRLKAQRAVIKQLAYIICLIVFFAVILPYIRGFLLTNKSTLEYTLQFIFGLRFLGGYVVAWAFAIWLILNIRPLRRGVGFIFSFLWPIGGLLRRFALARFFECLAMLTAAGLPNARAAKYAIDFSGHLRIERALTPIIEKLRQGSTLHAALSQIRIVPPDIVDHIKVTESTGEPEKGLHFCAKELTSFGRHITSTGISLIEVSIIFLFGFLIIMRSIAI